MSPQRFTLDWRDGFLCVRWDTTDSSEPLIVSQWWAIRRCSLQEVTFHMPEPLGESLRDLRDGVKRPKGVRNCEWNYGAWRVVTKTRRYELVPEFPPIVVGYVPGYRVCAGKAHHHWIAGGAV